MRESMGATFLMQLAILFVLLFTAIMALTINNSTAFGVKDSVITILEKFNGFQNFDSVSSVDNSAMQDIVDAMSNNSYRITGKCNTNNETGYKGFDRDGNLVGADEKASICIKEIDVSGGLKSYYADQGYTVVMEYPNLKYYEVVVFYQLDIPVIGSAFSFRSKATTKVLNTQGGAL